jgi:hypothetical protein
MGHVPKEIAMDEFVIICIAIVLVGLWVLGKIVFDYANENDVLHHTISSLDKENQELISILKGIDSVLCEHEEAARLDEKEFNTEWSKVVVARIYQIRSDVNDITEK